MTRIMLRLLLLMLGEGLILLSSADTTTLVVPRSAINSESTFSSDVENNSFAISTEPSKEAIMLGEKTTVGTETSDQTVNKTLKESDAKWPVDHTTVLVDEVKDPTSTDAVPESASTSMDVKLLDSKSTNPEDLVDSTEHPSESNENTESNENEHTESNENKTDSTGYATDSLIIAKDLLHSKRKTDAMTTFSPKSSTQKRSLISSTDSSNFNERTTTTSYDFVQPQTSSVVSDSAESHSSKENSGTEKSEEYIPDADISIPHRSYDLEKEAEITTLSKEELEFLAMAGTENHEKVVSSEGKPKPILMSRPVEVMSQQHGVLSTAETKRPVDRQNNVGSVENVGVTFDPDGMTHDGPQDPDSVVFHVPDSKEKESGEDSREREFSSEEESFEVVVDDEEGSFEKEGNPNERKIVPIRKFEKLEDLEHTESNTPEHEGEDVRGEVPSTDSPIPIFFENGATLPEFQIHNYTGVANGESEEMLQDAPPHGVNTLPEFAQSIPEESAIITEKQDPGKSSNEHSTANTMTTSADIASVSQIPDQSIIRPVKVSSPSENIASTSFLPGSPSTQFREESSTTVSNPSVPIAGLVDDKVVESSSPRSSSPILPEPVFKVSSGNVEVSTTIPQPELVDSVNATQNETSNSTFSRIEVKSSVSVSLPSPESNNGSQSSQLSTSTNSSLSSVDPPIVDKESNETSFPTTTETSTTRFKILKPKLKIGSDSGPSRRPYVPRRPGPATEPGPPVSIFKKQRTRIASITSSTTARPFRAFSTVRIHYATHHGVAILPELIISTEPAPTTTTEPPTTTTEEPIEEEPFTDQTVMPVVADEADTTLVKVAGYIALDRGIRWDELLDNRQTPEYKENSEKLMLHLERLFRSSPIAARLWKIEIDGFSGSRYIRAVGVDFFLYLIKSTPIAPEHLESIFREKLSPNRTFGTYRVDVDKTAFEVLQEEPLLKATPPPDDDDEGVEPPIPQWAIACIVIGAASLIFIVLFAAVTLYGRHHMRRRYSSSQLKEGEEEGRGDWESKMAAAYENMAADTLYDADENTYKKQAPGRIATFHGVPSPLKRCDSWSSTGKAPRWTQHFD